MSESNRVESNLSRFETNRTFFGPVRFDRIEQPLGSTRFDSIGALLTLLCLPIIMYVGFVVRARPTARAASLRHQVLRIYVINRQNELRGDHVTPTG
jgi:hypothetical protein